MTPEHSLPPHLEALAASLASLAPEPARLDRDRLMYEAGRAAASTTAPAGPESARPLPAQWLWPLATAALAVLVVAQGIWHMARTGDDLVQRDSASTLAEVSREPSSAKPLSPDTSEPLRDSSSGARLALGGGGTYLELRGRLLADEWEESRPRSTTPREDGATPPPADYRQLREALLGG